MQSGHTLSSRACRAARRRRGRDARCRQRGYRQTSRAARPFDTTFARAPAEPVFAPRDALAARDARTFARVVLGVTQAECSAAFRSSPLKRAQPPAMKRNAAVVLGKDVLRCAHRVRGVYAHRRAAGAPDVRDASTTPEPRARPLASSAGALRPRGPRAARAPCPSPPGLAAPRARPRRRPRELSRPEPGDQLRRAGVARRLLSRGGDPVGEPAPAARG
jgi:hypothetical protein